MSYQQCTRFWTTPDFDREYLWNGSSNQQAENGVINYNFSTLDENNLVNFGPLTKKMTLTFDLRPLNPIRFVRLSRYMFVQNVIKLSAAAHELSCAQRKKTLDENNTVRRYRADINNKRPTHEHSGDRHAGFDWHQSINQSIDQSIWDF